MARSRRRLSCSSDVSTVSADSDYSLVSAAPSIQSLDTNGSILGGVVLELESVKLEDTENEPASAQSSASDESQSAPTASPFWFQYPGFEPNPRAPFKHELGRLSSHIGAKTKNQKKDLQKLALTAEIKFHYGASMGRLDRWQELCEEVGIEKIPTSITQCQKVCIATYALAVADVVIGRYEYC